MQHKYLYRNLESISDNIAEEERNNLREAMNTQQDALKHHVGHDSGRGITLGKLLYCRRQIKKTDEELRKDIVYELVSGLEDRIDILPESDGRLKNLMLEVSPIVENNREGTLIGLTIMPKSHTIYIAGRNQCGVDELNIEKATNRFIEITTGEYLYRIYYQEEKDVAHKDI
jgi:hypothetical protein